MRKKTWFVALLGLICTTIAAWNTSFDSLSTMLIGSLFLAGTIYMYVIEPIDDLKRHQHDYFWMKFGWNIRRPWHWLLRRFKKHSVNDCSVCSIAFCPHKEPLHFDKDGCPACYLDEKSKTPSNDVPPLMVLQKIVEHLDGYLQTNMIGSKDPQPISMKAFIEDRMMDWIDKKGYKYAEKVEHMETWAAATVVLITQMDELSKANEDLAEMIQILERKRAQAVEAYSRRI